MPNVTIFCLVLLSLSIIHHCQCLSTQESDVELEDELTHLLNSSKMKSDQYSGKKGYHTAGHFPFLSHKRTAIVHSDIRDGECQAEPVKLTASSGTIKSPGYDQGTYPNNANCQWLIMAPADEKIVITFDELSLEAGTGCHFDSLTLYDGSDTNSRKLGKFCTEAPSTISSTGPSVFASLQTDYSTNAGGFSLSWTFVEVVATTCGKPAVEPSLSLTRIVGGREARPHSWPWQCHLLLGSLGCGGSVISENYILTAAHCFYDQENNRIPDDRVTVRCGLHKQWGDPLQQKFTQVSSVLHPKYWPYSDDFDIALIRLSTPLAFSDYVQPVCLPSTPIAAGTKCVVTGWGNTEGTADSSVLQQVVVPIISLADCRSINYMFNAKLTENMMCAGYMEGGKDSCKGDSGGPLVCKQGDRWLQYGIVSFGWGCADPNEPGVYTNVVKFLPWILDNSGIEGSARMA